jgi:hypothetical protein
VQHNLAVNNAIHEKNAPTHSLVGRCHTHKGPEMSAGHRDASRDGVTFGDLLLNLVLKVRKGRTHEWVTLENLLQSRMLAEAREVVTVKSVEEATNHGFAFFT